MRTKNIGYIADKYKFIKLTKGQYAKVDARFYEILNQYKWYAQYCHNTKTYYAVRFATIDGKKTKIYMQREIMKMIESDKLSQSGMQVDHINHDTLDNTIANLRVVTNRQNQQNRDLNKKSSKFLGVYWHKHSKKWKADGPYDYITKKNKYLGLFNTEEEAARAFDKYVKTLQWYNDKLNFPEEE